MNSASTDRGRGRLLLAGDPAAAGDACALLRAAGHRADVVCPAEAATAAGAGYDMVVAIGPLEVCARLIADLRCEPRLDRLIILAACDPGDAAAFSTLAGGADDITTWPLDPRELLFRVARGLSIARLRDGLTAAERRLREHALSDPLTGLANRRAMEQIVVREAARVSRAGSESCVVCIDVDGFQAVNEVHGEAVGDLVLLAFSGAIRGSLRAQDELARMDADEFVLLLRDTTLAGAVDACCRLRDAVSTVRVPLGRGDLALSASFGIAPLRPGDEPGQVLDVADCALYAARSAGRSQIETATESLA